MSFMNDPISPCATFILNKKILPWLFIITSSFLPLFTFTHVHQPYSCLLLIISSMPMKRLWKMKWMRMSQMCDSIHIVDIRAGIIFIPLSLYWRFSLLFFIIHDDDDIQFNEIWEIYWSVFLCEAFMNRIDKVSGVLHTYWAYKDKKWICCTYVCIQTLQKS